MKTTASTYDKQATAFLDRFAVSLAIKPATRNTPAPWAESAATCGNRYRVTLSALGRQPVRFDFWGSISDAKADRDPSPYDVLACISGDLDCPATFADFCAEYGYDLDSRSAHATFKRCRALAVKLQAFFREGPERDTLREIN